MNSTQRTKTVLGIAGFDAPTVHEGVLAALKEIGALQATIATLTAELETERMKHYAPQHIVADLLSRLGQAGYGKPGNPNTLWDMTVTAIADVERLTKERDGLATGWADVRALREIAKFREAAHLAIIETLYGEADVLELMRQASEVSANVDDTTNEKVAADVLAAFKDEKARDADYAKKADA